MIGQTVTHYRILDQLGGGGMGVVYRAEDLRLGRGVAIKFLPEGMARDAPTLERFQREARAASALNHPHICTIHEIDEWEGQPFIVMELMEGSTLKHRIGGRPLPIAEVVDLSLQIVEGLEAAHEAGIVHRDIKPANLFVTRRGQAKILDFGLAKHAPPPSAAPANAELEPTRLPQEAALTGTHVTVGTAAYMSPEQARGELVDARSDLFSLGVVMFELATGRTPFSAESSAEIIARILEHAAPPPSQLNPHVPPELDRIILAALEKDRKLRTQSAEELGAELARLRRDVTSQKVATPPVQVAAPAVPVAAPAAHVAAVPARTAAGRRWRLLAAGGAVALALAAAVWLGRQAKSPAPPAAPAAAQASVAVLPFVDMSPGKDQEYFSDGLTEELLNALAQIPELRVAARTSSFAFKGKEVSVTEIGRQLNVSTLLEGSVRKAEDQVRITAQLIKVDDGFHLWSESYDRQLDDIFAVQEDIARAVAGALQVTLLPGDGAAGPSPEGVAPEAYTAYLEGRYFTDRRGEEEMRRAVERFERAIALAPSYAPAWAGLARAFSVQGQSGHVPVAEAFPKARQAAERALALDESLAAAHAVLAEIRQQYDWDFRGAQAAMQRALALAPKDAGVLLQAAQLEATWGRFAEALELDRRAAALDPLNPTAHFRIGMHAYFDGRPEEAVPALGKTLELHPTRPGPHWVLGLLHLQQARPESALREFEAESHPIFRRQGLALAHFALGPRAEADAALADLLEQDHETAAIQIAQVYAFRGERDEAFAWLDRAYAQRDSGFSQTKGAPLFQSLEGDPRYRALLVKLGLED